MELLLPQPEEAEMVICKGHRLRENRNWDHGSRDQSWPPGPLPAPSPLFTSWEPTPVRLWAPTWRDLAGCAPGSFSLTHTWHTLGLEVWACPSIKADSDGKKVWPSPPTRSLRESCTAGWFAEASAGRWFEKFLKLNTTIDSGIRKTLPTPQEEKQPLTTSKAPTFVAGVVMPAEWSRRSISPFFPWHRVSKNARLPQPGWRMSWAPGWDLSPRHPLLGLQQGLQLEGGGGFPHAQREELLRLSTNWECESARMSGDGQALCHGLQIQMYTHTHTLPGIYKLAMPSDHPHCVPSFVIPVHIPSVRRYCWHFGQWVPSPKNPRDSMLDAEFSFAVCFCTHCYLSPIHTQLWFIPSFPSRLQSQSSQGLSFPRLEENCPRSQTFSTHQCGHLRGICTVWGRAFCRLGEGTVCAETPGYFSGRRKCSVFHLWWWLYNCLNVSSYRSEKGTFYWI